MSRKIQWKALITDLLFYIAGSILFGLGVYTFALNAQFAPGGISGLAIILYHFTGFKIGAITLVLNIPLILLSAKIIGFRFIGKSIVAMLISSFFLDFIFPLFPRYSGDPFLAAMFTGLFIGAGLAIVYMRGSSTGGSDFIIMVIKKVRPHFSIGQISLAFDGIVILLGGLVFKNIDAVLYGVVASFATTLMMDYVLYGAGSGKMAIIITNYGQEIAKAISNEVDRGSTLVKAIGTYTGAQRDMLLCACSKSEIYKVRTAAHAIDPGCMIMISEASEVFGEGFVPPPIPGNEVPEDSAQGSQPE